MKISGSIRRLHYDLREKYCPLKEEVDDILRNRKRASWHYESRLKDAESFTLKLETGRWKSLTDIDDLLGALIVVENFSALKDAESLIEEYFDIRKRRPPTPGYTTTQADSFPFDDLRFYVQWPSDSPVPKPLYKNLMFEIQLRTFLQHAWNVATHDIVYKSEVREWPRERIAAQVRASLEQAEVTLHEIDKLAKSDVLCRVDRATRRMERITRLLQEYWHRARLPGDVKRLATNVYQLIDAASISIPRLRCILDHEQKEGRGAVTENLSPFHAIIQSLIYREPEAMRRVLRDKGRKFTVCIPSELEFPPEFDPEYFHDVIEIPS